MPFPRSKIWFQNYVETLIIWIQMIQKLLYWHTWVAFQCPLENSIFVKYNSFIYIQILGVLHLSVPKINLFFFSVPLCRPILRHQISSLLFLLYLPVSTNFKVFSFFVFQMGTILNIFQRAHFLHMATPINCFYRI